MLKSQINHRDLSIEEKLSLKQKLLVVTALLTKWSAYYPDRPMTELKNEIFRGVKNPFDKIPEAELEQFWQDQKVIMDFQTKILPEFGVTAEIALLESFMKACYKEAKRWARRVSSSLNLTFEDAFEDLLQDAYKSVLSSMYYFTESDKEVSTYVIGSLRKSLERATRYDYCKLSPVSPDDLKMLYTYNRESMAEGRTFEEIVSIMGLNEEQIATLSDVIRPVKREAIVTNHDKEVRTLELVPCRRSDSENECLETFSLIKSFLDPSYDRILNLTEEEKKVIRAGMDNNFARGWQSSFAANSLSPNTGRPYTRQRVGQLFDSASSKIKPLLQKVRGVA
jgi:hypothetical protein